MPDLTLRDGRTLQWPDDPDDAALVFAPWPFRVEDVRCPVTLWYGERDANAPPRNGAWLADRLPEATLSVLPGLGHLESLVRTWDRILASFAEPR